MDDDFSAQSEAPPAWIEDLQRGAEDVAAGRVLTAAKVHAKFRAQLARLAALQSGEAHSED